MAGLSLSSLACGPALHRDVLPPLLQRRNLGLGHLHRVRLGLLGRDVRVLGGQHVLALLLLGQGLESSFL